MRYEQSKEKISTIYEAVKNYSILIGEEDDSNKIPGLEEVPGLGMTVESEGLMVKAEDIRKGIFKVIAMGEFKRGKSTLINAIIGKETVPVKTTACTAIITVLVYGSNIDRAFVYKESSPEPIEMSLEDFFEEYKLTYKDQDIIEEQGRLDRFADVEYAVIECEHPIIENGVRIIDSPGLGEADSRNKTTMNFIPNADAIIFLLDAVHLFSKNDKEYIRENFSDRQLKNVFFVINRINQINEPLESIKPDVERPLRSVFKDEDGNLDKELFSKRVFYVNAYGAFKAKESGHDDDLEDTGFVEFEKNLEEFLTSDDRMVATFQSTLTSMANKYKKAEAQIEDKKQALSTPLEKLKKNHVQSEKVLNDLETKIEDIRKIYRSTCSMVQSKIYYSLIDFVSTQMPNMWEADVEKLNVKFGMQEMGKLATSVLTFNKDKREEKQNRIMQPVAKEIKDYIIEKMDEWGKTTDLLIQPEIDNLYRELSIQGEEFSLELTKASKIFSGNLDEQYTNDSKASSVQLGLSILFFDPSIFVENAAGGNFSWGEWIKKFVVQVVIQTLIFTIFTGGLAWIVFIIVEAFQINSGSTKMKDKLLKEISVKLFSKLKEEIQHNQNLIYSGIGDKFEEQLDKVCESSYKLIDDERKRQNEIIKKKSKKEMDYVKEVNRMDSILQMMSSLLGNVYYEMYNKKMTKEDINKIGVNTNKGNKQID
ncbi:dynamin family protein [Clostridium sp. DL1XJH146]